MISEINPRARQDRFGKKINRDSSALLAFGLPFATILLGSLTPVLPLIAAGPVMPPLGYLMFVAWRLVRPGLLPLWVGLPLGAFDDLFSGQPFGSAILLWSLTMLGLEVVEARFPWRGFWQDWAAGAVLIAGYLSLSAMFAGPGIDLLRIPLIAPQLVLSILLFPVIARLAAMFDRVRLLRIKVLR
jgi:rod shape-determining protein MreD